MKKATPEDEWWMYDEANTTDAGITAALCDAVLHTHPPLTALPLPLPFPSRPITRQRASACFLRARMRLAATRSSHDASIPTGR
jgi:hypothetical protein